MRVFFSPKESRVDDRLIDEGTIVKVLIGPDDNTHSAKMYEAQTGVMHGFESTLVSVLILNECLDEKVEVKDILEKSGINPRPQGSYYLCPRHYLWAIES